MNYTALEQESENEDSASDNDSNECAAAESEDEIVDGTVPQSPMKNRTRIKSRKVVIPEALTCSDSEDELPRPQPRKHNRASPAPLKAGGHSKYFQRNSNRFSSIASKKLAQRKSTAGGRARE